MIGLKHHVFSTNGPFEPEGSRGTTHWRANDALGHVKQRKFKFDGFVSRLDKKSSNWLGGITKGGESTINAKLTPYF